MQQSIVTYHLLFMNIHLIITEVILEGKRKMKISLYQRK